jgi:hypothetical protein
MPVFYGIRRVLFPTWREFHDALRNTNNNTEIDMLLDHSDEDYWGGAKLLVGLLGGFACVAAEYCVLVKYVLP